ncbi:hypothetical protein BDN70DRAFT_936436 [Pholiota conissans]|uniref:Uncharacterized protein n=1 Tax=Pholiota conissans TaxID=109636 RepID=A0A9P5YVM7_9AGAR|nr:hypothetical protein BDN70DRAFT_936436 [Pholiota conissans]
MKHKRSREQGIVHTLRNIFHDNVACHRTDAYNETHDTPSQQNLSQYVCDQAQPEGMYNTDISYQLTVYSSATASSSSSSYLSSQNPTSTPQISFYDTVISSSSSYPPYPNPTSKSQSSDYASPVLPVEDPQYDYNLDYAQQMPAQRVVQPVSAYRRLAELPQVSPSAVIPVHNLPVPLSYPIFQVVDPERASYTAQRQICISFFLRINNDS